MLMLGLFSYVVDSMQMQSAEASARQSSMVCLLFRPCHPLPSYWEWPCAVLVLGKPSTLVHAYGHNVFSCSACKSGNQSTPDNSWVRSKMTCAVKSTDAEITLAQVSKRQAVLKQAKIPQDLLGLLLAPALPWRASACQLCMAQSGSRAAMLQAPKQRSHCDPHQL